MQIFVPTHPIEAELVIRPKLEGYFDCEILHPNGMIEKPWDKPQKNTISTAYINQMFTGGGNGPPFFHGINGGTALNMPHNAGQALVIGPSDATIAAANLRTTNLPSEGGTLLGARTYWTTTRAGSGNVADIDSTTGNAILTVNMIFSAAPVAHTVREVCLTQSNNDGGTRNWFSGSATWSFNRAVLPTPITVNQGAVLTLSYTLVIPTLAVTAQTVTLAAQNGMNISGQLKLIGTKANILGGSVTGAGVMTAINGWVTVGTGGGGMIFPSNARGSLVSDTTFPAFNTNASNWGVNLQSSSSWSAYNTNTYTRTYETVWNSAFATTNFRSITLHNGSGTYGYQLLLDNQQTKELNKTLTVGWTFGVQV